jgi:hypothetical protein
MRITTENGVYEFKFECPKCKSKNYITVNNGIMCLDCSALISLEYLILDVERKESASQYSED